MFKKVEQYPPFAVNENGIVMNTLSGKIAPQNINSRNKYVYTSAWVDGKTVAARVHRLIAIAFIPNPEKKPCVNHKNSIRHDNRIKNLEWVTHSENMKHALEFGFAETRKGEKSNLCIYSEDDIREACVLLADGYRIVDIEKITGLTRSVINHVKAGNSWVHVSSDYFNLKHLPSKSKILSVEKVKYICELFTSGKTTKQVSDFLNINYNTIKNIRDRKTYRTISKPFNW